MVSMTMTGRVFRLALCAAAAALIASPFPARADQPESAKRQQIREIIEITNAADLGERMIEFMVGRLAPAFEAMNPGKGAVVSSILRREFMAVTAERRADFEEIIVLVYDERFSAEEIDGLLTFYRSPLGRRLIEEMPAIVDRSMQAGQLLGEEIGREALRRAISSMQEQGLDTRI